MCVAVARLRRRLRKSQFGGVASACANFALAVDFFAVVDLKAELGPSTGVGTFGGVAGARGGAFARASLDDAAWLLMLLQTVLSAWKSAHADDRDDAALQKATPRHLRLYLDARSPRLLWGKTLFSSSYFKIRRPLVRTCWLHVRVRVRVCRFQRGRVFFLCWFWGRGCRQHGRRHWKTFECSTCCTQAALRLLEHFGEYVATTLAFRGSVHICVFVSLPKRISVSSVLSLGAPPESPLFGRELSRRVLSKSHRDRANLNSRYRPRSTPVSTHPLSKFKSKIARIDSLYVGGWMSARWRGLGARGATPPLRASARGLRTVARALGVQLTVSIENSSWCLPEWVRRVSRASDDRE